MYICSEKNEVCSTPFCGDIQHSKHVDSAIWLSSWSWPMRHQSCSSAGLWPGKRTRPANKGNKRFKTSTHQHKTRQWVQMSCWMMRKIWFHSSTSLFAANVFHKCPCLGGAYNLVETYCKREVFRKYAWTPSNIYSTNSYKLRYKYILTYQCWSWEAPNPEVAKLMWYVYTVSSPTPCIHRSVPPPSLPAGWPNPSLLGSWWWDGHAW